MYRVTVSAEDAALMNLCEDGLQRVAATLDHVARVNHLATLSTVLSGRVKVVELEGGRMSIVAALLATTGDLDPISDGP